jgi:hypothetical protein
MRNALYAEDPIFVDLDESQATSPEITKRLSTKASSKKLK